MKWLFPLLFFLPCLHAQKAGQGPADPGAAGNLSLPTSQQPGPLLAFGENILDQNQVQIFIPANAFIGNNSYSTNIAAGVVWGIANDLSLFVNIPFSPRSKDRHDHSAGLEDSFAQLEYVFYNGQQPDYANQATLVANVTFPTGSSTKNPPSGFGSTSFFLGSTFNHTEIDWLFFLSPGVQLTTTKHGTKFGDQLFYQFGFGRNIPSPAGWIFAWIVELDGLFTWKNKFKGHTDHNSGGNVIYVAPSIWISSRNLIIQVGAGYPIVQHLFGHQSKKFLSLDFNFGVTF
ncbi:MAG: hypothetical protein JSS10_06255 [Verrucomicrobia bacterium]|nr:hypothetical protein [Verrucomicrobiota bacterium]